MTVVIALAFPGGAGWAASSSAPLDREVQNAVAAAITGEAEPEALIRLSGKPDADYLYRGLSGEIDLFVQKQDNGAVAAQLARGEQVGRRVVDLRVLEWRGSSCACSAILVFKGDRFLYGMLPVAGSEDSTGDLASRYADPPKVLDVAGPGVRARLYAYPDRGIGYVATGPGPFAFKVAFPVGTKAADFRGAFGASPAGGSNVRAPAVASPPVTPPPGKGAAGRTRR